MAASAEKTDPKLWEQVKLHVTQSDKGGRAGQWSARKAQIAVQEYKAKGGQYRGKKTADNHLTQWTREEWGTKSGGKSLETGERYLPKRARATLTDGEYRRTTEKKRADTRRGKQFSRQPADVAGKTATVRLDALPMTELRQRAREKGIVGRAAMRKADLVKALRQA